VVNIFRTLPGPGEFSELAPPLSRGKKEFDVMAFVSSQHTTDKVTTPVRVNYATTAMTQCRNWKI